MPTRWPPGGSARDHLALRRSPSLRSLHLDRLRHHPAHRTPHDDPLRSLLLRPLRRRHHRRKLDHVAHQTLRAHKHHQRTAKLHLTTTQQPRPDHREWCSGGKTPCRLCVPLRSSLRSPAFVFAFLCVSFFVFAFLQATESITFAVATIFISSFSAQKSLVKPRNHLTSYHPTTSAWHVSYVPFAIMDI